MSLASFFCSACGTGYHEHEGHQCKALWTVTAPDGRVWRSSRLLSAVSAAIEETKLQFPAGATFSDGQGGYFDENAEPLKPADGVAPSAGEPKSTKDTDG